MHPQSFKTTSSLLIGLALTFAAARVARADFYPIPLTPGSFNYDVVVEKTATPPYQTRVTATMDAGTNIAGLQPDPGNVATGLDSGGNQGAYGEIGFANSGTA